DRTMRGRIPAGPQVVDQLQGSQKAKDRLRVILMTMAGQLRAGEACARLGISEQRFRPLRAGGLQTALGSPEDHPAGGPRRAEEPPETTALRQELVALQRELEASQVREEIALALPKVADPRGLDAARPGAQKKRRRRR